MVKVVAAKRGVELRTHGDLWEFVTKLRTELKDPELVGSFYRRIICTKTFTKGFCLLKQ